MVLATKPIPSRACTAVPADSSLPVVPLPHCPSPSTINCSIAIKMYRNNTSPYGFTFTDYMSTQKSKLPVIPDLERISPRAIRILGDNPGQMTLQGTNTYLLDTGRERMLVDAGQGLSTWQDRVVEDLTKEDLVISKVILTHWHRDHTGRVPPLLERYPHLEGHIYKRQPLSGQTNIEEGQQFSCEGATLTAFATPSHAKDHTCFVLHEDNALLTGDNVLGHGMAMIEDLGTYMTSFAAMKSRKCAIGYPAHGILVPDLPKKLAEYMDHRVRREQQVSTTLQQLREERKKKEKIGTISLEGLATKLYGEARARETIEGTLKPMTLEILFK